MAGLRDQAWGSGVTRADAAAAGSVAPPGFVGRPQVPTVEAPLRPAASLPIQPRRRSIGGRPAIAAAVAVAAAAAAIAVLAPGSRPTVDPAAGAIAAAINLRAGDLPGFRVGAPDHTSTGSQFSARMKACVGSGLIAQFNHGQLADISSPSFTSGSGLQAEQVSSGVTIVPSSATMGHDLAAVDSGRIQSCLASALDGISIATRSGTNVTVNYVKVTSIPTAGGADGSFGMRATIGMGALGIDVPVVTDILGYGVGRDELTLETVGVGRPFPHRMELRLSSLLVSRALARPH